MVEDAHWRGNLPAELNRTVGRRAQSAEVRRLLGSARLVTLTGPGGVGKTRLAIQVARQSHRAFRDGVWLVPLADLTQPDLLALTIVSALPLESRTGMGINELTDVIGDRDLLLVLDNCEHLIEACAKVTTDLLRNCPNLRVLATSRQPIRTEGETLFEVPPLSVPEPGDGLASGAVTQYDAVQLFVERASAVSPNFSLDAEHEQAVIALCRRLDGLPLAIELAAVGVRAMSIEQLLDRQDDRFRVLTAGSRTSPPRHRTLRATMDYSYQLCSPEARLLWARMSVFAGSADLDAIETVCTGHDYPTESIPQALHELVDNSIVTFHDARYRMLETINHYGQERLREREEEQRTRLAHRDYFARLADEVAAGWFGPGQPALFDRVLADHANVRAALEFSLTEPGQLTVGLGMAGKLWNFWVGCGLQSEGRRWLDRLLAANAEPTPERVTALWANAAVAIAQADFPTAARLLDECQELAGQLGEQAYIAHATQMRGVLESKAGRTGNAIRHLEEAVRLERQLPGFNPYLAVALLNLGAALCNEDQVERAVEVLEEVKTYTPRGEQWLLSWNSVLRGLVAIIKNRATEAAALVKDGLTHKRDLDDLLGIGFALELLAWAAIDGGDAERGAQLLGAARALAGPLGGFLGGFERLLGWHDQYASRARDTLGQRAFDSALEQGRQLSKDRALAYALGETAPASQPAPGDSEHVPLTPRERQIAELVAKGKSNRQIAQELVIAVRTAEAHVENILTKLGFTSRTQIAAQFATTQQRDVS